MTVTRRLAAILAADVDAWRRGLVRAELMREFDGLRRG
jgi:hypothetical protein